MLSQASTSLTYLLISLTLVNSINVTIVKNDESGKAAGVVFSGSGPGFTVLVGGKQLKGGELEEEQVEGEEEEEEQVEKEEQVEEEDEDEEGEEQVEGEDFKAISGYEQGCGRAGKGRLADMQESNETNSDRNRGNRLVCSQPEPSVLPI